MWDSNDQSGRTRSRSLVAGGLIGLALAGTLALPAVLPPAMADEEPVRTLLKSSAELQPKVINGDAFVKPDWTVADSVHIVEPWVSTTAESVSTVRKIGYGRTKFVSIATTSTGVYSSDGLKSPNFRYPGIHTVKPQPRPYGRVAIWAGGWRAVSPTGADSFVFIPFKDGQLLITENGRCVATRFSVFC